MRRFYGVLLVLSLLAAVIWVGLPASSQVTSAPAESSLPAAGLIGTVKSLDGEPMEGVPVSARAVGRTFATSVYTNREGQYFFPPLGDGQYRMWAQAVGYEITYAEQTLSSGKRIQQDFLLKPSMGDLFKQLSDAEMMNSLPDETPEDRRKAKIFLNNCGTCHETGYALLPRLDAAGWELIVDACTLFAGRQDPPSGVGCCGGIPAAGEFVGGGKHPHPELDEKGRLVGPMRRLMGFYKKDIMELLTRVRGPEPFPFKFKALPRPTGEATQIVVTEYDLPRERGALGKLDPNNGRVTLFRLSRDGSTEREEIVDYFENNLYRSGSDWSRSVRSDSQEEGAHDAAVATDGNIYFDGLGTIADANGNVWTGTRQLLRLDVKTQKLQAFPKPSSLSSFHNGKGVDSKGNVWVSQHTGAHRINPKTGEHTEFKAVTQVGRPYDLTVDSEDNVWFAQVAIDRVGVVDGRTGKVSEVVLPPLDEGITAADREIGQRTGGGWTMSAPLYLKGPRRMDSDPNGDAVWVGLFWVSRLAKIDIHTKKVTEYKLPQEYQYSYIYDTVVDKNHMVWFNMANADRIGKFNPVTEKFTFYELPTRGTDSRHIWVDNRTDPPSLIVPYTGSNKIARVQFRTSTAR